VQYGAVSTVFTAANWTTNPARITVDNPNTRSGPITGAVTLAGWAIDDYEAVSSVAIAVDGVAYGNASYGTSRPDVCIAFPARAGCPNVGWNFLLDTTWLSDGAHVLAVTATMASGRRSTISSPFTVSNSSGNPIVITVDSPALNGTASGLVHAYGWALDTASGVGIASTQILLDGVSYGPATYGASRPDVCAVYSGTGCPNVGWDFSLDTTALANGTHAFEVRAVSTTGQQRTVSNSFQVLNGPFQPN
jgi:hypothetical protein